MGDTEIRRCSCTSVQQFEVKCAGSKVKMVGLIPWFSVEKGAEFQNGRYGQGLRVHNLGPKTATCSVCGRVKDR